LYRRIRKGGGQGECLAEGLQHHRVKALQAGGAECGRCGARDVPHARHPTHAEQEVCQLSGHFGVLKGVEELLVLGRFAFKES
jgi:hypothetical protein